MLVKHRNRHSKTFDRFFDDFFTKDVFSDVRASNYSTPKVNISETKTAFTVYLEAPGYSKDVFTIELDENLLKVSAAVEKDTNSEERFQRKEFELRPFNRTFTVPEDINADEISANYESGILTLILPKLEKPANEPKKIDIK